MDKQYELVTFNHHAAQQSYDKAFSALQSKLIPHQITAIKSPEMIRAISEMTGKPEEDVELILVYELTQVIKRAFPRHSATRIRLDRAYVKASCELIAALDRMQPDQVTSEQLTLLALASVPKFFTNLGVAIVDQLRESGLIMFPVNQEQQVTGPMAHIAHSSFAERLSTAKGRDNVMRDEYHLSKERGDTAAFRNKLLSLAGSLSDRLKIKPDLESD